MIYTNIIYQNNHVDIIYKACKLCYLGKLSDDINEKLKYIQEKVKAGHESVLEHSNIVMIITDPSARHFELAEVLSASRHLNSSIKQVNEVGYYLLGGSIRAYKNIFRNIKNCDNKIAKAILNELYNLNKEYFYDFIEAGIMSEYRFNEMAGIDNESHPLDVNSDRVSISNIDNNITEMMELTSGIFDMDDLMDMCTVTIFFEDMSRVITQQLTRHRNAISQRSQRYVDESMGEVNNPLKYSDYLPSDMKFKTSFGELTLVELGNKLNSVYAELKAAGLHKEDARYYLTNGIKSALYVTFTFRNLIYFLSLRTDSHAQAEIRMDANNIFDAFVKFIEPYAGKEIYSYILPKYMAAEVDYDMYAVEEVIEEYSEEVIDGTKTVKEE